MKRWKVPAPWWWKPLLPDFREQLDQLAASTTIQPQELEDRALAVLWCRLSNTVPRFVTGHYFPNVYVGDVKAFAVFLAAQPEFHVVRSVLLHLADAAGRGALDKAVARRHKPPTRPWRAAFSRATRGYFLSGSRNASYQRPGYGWPTDSATDPIRDMCAEYYFPETGRGSYNPGSGVEAYHLYIPFLDGGYASCEGNHLYGPHGVYVVGELAFRLVCLEMGLNPPRRPAIATVSHADLARRALVQLGGETDALRAQWAALDSIVNR